MSADGMAPVVAVDVAPRRRARVDWRDMIRGALPVVALVTILVWIGDLESTALSYDGLNLLISTAVPLVFASIAQMLMVMIGDIDLGIGAFVGLTNVVIARYLGPDPLIGVLLIVAGIAAYGLLGLVIHVRRIPSIVGTLGASFVWFGLALLILPSPGGSVPGWLGSLWAWSPPLLPLPVLIAVVVAVTGYLLCNRVPYGVVLRGAGDDPAAVERAGWSILRVRVTVYALAGLLGTLAGLSTTAVTASGDANASSGLTLLSVAAVVLGGGEFSGGIANAVGAVIGAVAISLVAPLLALLNVSSDYQAGIQGGILLAVLAGRALARRDV
jgi:ribose transport system permease protein